MRAYVSFYILLLLLNLPFQTMSFFKSWSHVQGHHHTEADHDHEDQHKGHDPETSISTDTPLSHRHAPNQPFHSHEKDFWGLFAHLGISSGPVISQASGYILQFLAHFEVNERICQTFCEGLLRPPIFPSPLDIFA